MPLDSATRRGTRRRVGPLAPHAVMVHRRPLVRVLQDKCAALHEARRAARESARAAHQKDLEYWEAVLQWLEHQEGDEVLIVARRRKPVAAAP